MLIVVMSASLAGSGVWLSWAAAMAVTVTGTTTYIFRRAVPAFARASVPGTEHVPSLREVERFVGPDYVGALAWIAGTSLLPLLVLDLTSRRQAAVFALAWTICLALYQVPIAFGQSLVAHGVRAQDQLDNYYRQSMRHTLRLLVPVVVLIVALAPLGLSFFGDWYADNGVTTLRLLALSAVPNVVVDLAVSRARVARRMTTVVVVLVTLSALVLSLTVVLVPHMGIVGAAAAALVAQSGVGGALLVRDWAAGARRRVLRSKRGGVPSPMVRAALKKGKWQHERALATVSDTAVVMVRAPRGESAVLRVAATGNGVASLYREREVLSRLRSEERLGEWRALLPVPLDSGEVKGGGAFLVTSRLPGRCVSTRAAPGSRGAQAPQRLELPPEAFHFLAATQQDKVFKVLLVGAYRPVVTSRHCRAFVEQSKLVMHSRSGTQAAIEQPDPHAAIGQFRQSGRGLLKLCPVEEQPDLDSSFR